MDKQQILLFFDTVRKFETLGYSFSESHMIVSEMFNIVNNKG